MEKINRQRFRIILLLSIITVLLFGGIVINLSIDNYISATTSSLASPSVFLPAVSSVKSYGTEHDDSFVDAFFVGDDTYVFYNSECGVMQKDGENPLSVTMEGKIVSVALTPYGFALGIEKEDNLSIKIMGFDGIPSSSVSVTYKNARLEYLGYDSNVCVAIKHQGEFDYVLTYLKYDASLTEIYHRDIYSLYNLSAVACYPLSNKTVIFFNAQYGSVKRGGYSVIHNVSLSMQTEYFSGVTDYTVCDAKPYGNGFLVTALSDNNAYAIELDENMAQGEPKLLMEKCKGASIYTDSSVCYVGLDNGESVSLLSYNDNTVFKDFASSVYDCIFIDGAAVFAIYKSGVTSITHLSTGLSSPVISLAPTTLKLKHKGKLSLYTSLCAPSHVLHKGGFDVYGATLP
ncbi:MAG: hypothetical protein J6C23_04515 [Clostridia bacterium]|nr:hypothetical protein [Clostridia bacterium]